MTTEDKNRVLWKSHDVWRRHEGSLIRFRCFESLASGQFHVQSADAYYKPFDQEIMIQHDKQFLELLTEESPDVRSPGYDSIEEAIAEHDNDFGEMT
jgi:hypothetical protein